MQATCKSSPSKRKHQLAVGTLQAKLDAAWPNTSLKRSANGVPPGPRSSAGVHYLQRGPGATPLSPA
jgi:hypothetical protein